jgi:HlyD family secretion protein
MDVQKKASQPVVWRSKTKIAIAIGAAAIVALVMVLRPSNAVAISERELLLDSVQQGSLDVTVDGFGQLVSARQQLLSSPSRATVKEIVLKPGAKVTAGSVIALLEDPELTQSVETAKQVVNESQANLRKLMLNNQRERLREQSSLAELVSQREKTTVQRQAEEKLVSSGIVSRLTFEQTVQNEKQLNQRIALANQSMVQLDLLHRESVNIQQDQVKQMQGNLAIAQSQLDRLTVKAGLDGVLLKLPVEVGQGMSPGQEVALVGSDAELIALIRVPQGQAQSVHIGNTAIIDTRDGKLNGSVTRIVPIVANNTVEIEIKLPSIKGTSARPNLSVDCSIIGDRLDNVKYVRRPTGVAPNTSAQVYVVAKGDNTARPKQVRFGRQAGQHIEVISGLDAGERLVVSDLSKYNLDGEPFGIESR